MASTRPPIKGLNMRHDVEDQDSSLPRRESWKEKSNPTSRSCRRKVASASGVRENFCSTYN